MIKVCFCEFAFKRYHVQLLRDPKDQVGWWKSQFAKNVFVNNTYGVVESRSAAVKPNNMQYIYACHRR